MRSDFFAVVAQPLSPAGLVLAYVVVQRLIELAYARANTRRLLAEGGREVGRRHYPLFVLLHAAWLGAMLAHADPARPPDPVLLALFALSQVARFWTLASIGRWWTTRIVSAPSFPRVARGPYRYLRHPNYAVVIVEVALVPALLGLPWAAALFSALNALLLLHRVAVEEEALRERL